jgi:dTMP kinase
MKEAALIVIEGIDGSGTTTVVERAVAHFRALGRRVSSTREPSGGPVGALIRQVLSHRLVVPAEPAPGPPGWATMALLFAADRLDHLEAEVMPQLRAGVTVISDRYDLSSLAYQSATAPSARPGSDDAVAWIRALNSQARRPDLTLVLDVSPESAAERRRARGQSHELYEKAELQARLARIYARAETLVPGDRLVHIDAERPIDVVLAAAISVIEALENQQV